MFEELFSFGTEGSMAYILPFFLMFALVYGALDVSGMFKNRKVSTLISIILALFAISLETARVTIVTYMPYVALIFIVFFFLGFLKKLFSGKDKQPDYVILGIIAMLILLFLVSQTSLLESLSSPFGGENIILIAGLVLIAFIFYSAYKYSSGKK